MRPSVYDHVRVLPFEPFGYLSTATQEGLSRLIAEHHVSLAVEIGSLFGKSAVHIATALPAEGTLYCVDPWTYDARTADQDPKLPHDWVTPPNVYHTFLSNIIQAGLRHKIVPCRATSLEARELLTLTFDLAYIDGHHTFQSVFQDVLAWGSGPLASRVLCGDDYWMPSVARGVSAAAHVLGKDVQSHAGFWWMEPRD